MPFVSTCFVYILRVCKKKEKLSFTTNNFFLFASYMLKWCHLLFWNLMPFFKCNHTDQTVKRTITFFSISLSLSLQALLRVDRKLNDYREYLSLFVFGAGQRREVHQNLLKSAKIILSNRIAVSPVCISIIFCGYLHFEHW